jgi:DNA-binding NarL/FixJ family response regulator
METPVRPRVLLADDHIAFLESVGDFLADAFDIVALASDGRQALDLAIRLRPDVVVLDIAMPELDGFQTLEELRRVCPDTRVVFLTMHRDDQFVSASIDSGAHGYVLKSRVHVDLIGAIDHALAGRLFVPSLTSLAAIRGSRHAVQIYADDRHYLDEVSRLVGATLRSGEQVVMVSNEAARIGVAQRLRAQHVDLTMLAERGQYVERDSVLALSHVMRGARPDKERLAEIVRSLDELRKAGPNGPRGRLTIAGDMSGSVCRTGDVAAALALERMWNELTRALPFFTMCSYASDCFDHPEARNGLSNVCAEHSAVTY